MPSHSTPSPLGPSPPLPPRSHDPATSRHPLPLPRTTLLERACGPCRVFVSVACLTIRVFVSAMKRSFTDGQPPRAPQGEGERMAPLSPCETDDSPNFFIPIGAARSQAISVYRAARSCAKSHRFTSIIVSVNDISLFLRYT